MLGLGLSIPQVAARGSRSLVAAIRSLFSANEPGVWYDPSDLSTLYQDSAGTTPVTAVEQPVGLILDKSKGLVLGPELVTNGDFSDGTMGWTAGVGSISVVSGEMRVVRSSNTSSAYQAISTVVGRTYKVTGLQRVVTPTSQPNLVARTGTDPSLGVIGFGNPTTSTVLEANTFYFTAVGTTTYLHLTAGAAAGEVAFDNISVRELPGNHASQPTAISRPVLSARVNLLTKTEQFDDVAWLKFNSTITANTTTAPDGATTADKLVENNLNDFHCVYSNNTFQSSYVFSIYAKSAERKHLAYAHTTLATPSVYFNVVFDLDNASITQNINSSTAVYTPSITSVGSGWVRITIVLTNLGNLSDSRGVRIATSNTATPTVGDYGSNKYTGDGTSGIFIWGASLVPANQASLPYQRVNTATDYDTAGFPHYLRFDGVDDWLVTPTITPGVDKVQVFAGVRKLSDATAGLVAELSANINSNNGAFCLFAPANASPSGDYGVASRGSVFSGSTTARNAVNAPDTSTVTLTADIAGDLVALRTDGVSRSSGTGDQGTGNFLAYPLYIGRRGGTTLPFNGHLYSLIVRFGSNLPAATIEKTEKYINTKTGAY